MRIWTYGEMNDKVQMDLDLEDETFIKPNEMIGYFNEALTEAEAEILLLNQDYLRTRYYVPLVPGTSRYALPKNIFANKIRGIQYSNGALIYPVSRLRRMNEFDLIALINAYGQSDDYSYYPVNDYPGQTEIILLPPSRDTAVLAPIASLFTPMILWYIRNCARVPLSGEYCNTEVIATAQVSTTLDTIQTYAGTVTRGITQQGVPGAYPGSVAYVTGDKVKFLAGPLSGTIPAPLVEGTVYYVIASGSGVIKIASSLANALAGTAINLTTAGTVYFTMDVAATTTIINATLIDIPEFSTFVMQWVKCRCMEKEGDPRLGGAVETLAQQRAQLNNTLATGFDDDDDKIQMDMSFYNEMS